LILIAILAFLAAGLRLANLNNVSTRSPDEKVYTWQAKTWVDQGLPGLRDIVADYNTDPESKLYPPPSRVGMIRLVAAVMKATGKYDESVGAWISCVASIGSVVVLAIIAFRFLPIWAAAAGMLFYSVFPGALAIARRTWTDALVEFAGLLLIWFVCEIARNSKQRIWYLLFALVGSLSLLVKESMPVPYGLCAIWILLVLTKRKQWINAAILIAATAVGMGLALWWLGSQIGSLSEYIGIVVGIPAANAANQYALEYASGPRQLMLQAFWIVVPFTSFFAVIGLLIAVFRLRDRAVFFLAFFSLVYIAIAMAMPHWINLRYVGNTFGPVCLLAGLGCATLIAAGWKRMDASDRRPFAVIAIGIVLGGATADYLRFRRFFVRDELVDLSIKMLVDERNQ
jgi:4-amino-4-deoxy-L-arabinose transferase-like glycosyltransferase